MGHRRSYQGTASDTLISHNQHPLRNFWGAITAELGPSLVPGDELVGDVAQVVADNLRLRTDS
jgi:hypothetical protein